MTMRQYPLLLIFVTNEFYNFFLFPITHLPLKMSLDDDTHVEHIIMCEFVHSLGPVYKSNKVIVIR